MANFTHPTPSRLASSHGAGLTRRQLLHLGALLAGAPVATHAMDAAHPGLPDPRPLQLGPVGSWRDHGSHPEWGTEWWYITGQLSSREPTRPQVEPEYGFQLTFFRTLVPNTASQKSGLAARHIMSAHLAVSDVKRQRLVHEERVARATQHPELGAGDAQLGDLRVRLGNWLLARQPSSTPGKAAGMHASLSGRDVALDLQFELGQPPIVQGDGGLSRKGPDARQVSYYYSLPQLQARGSLRMGQQTLAVRGQAWMDHEWSTALMHPLAVGWDWIGMNLADGAALTAFRLRDAQGNTLWTGGSWRGANAGAPRVFGGQDVHFTALRSWRSPHSKASYPVQWRIATPVGEFVVRALFDDQELDSRASTGTVYWEGLSELQDAHGQHRGWGYLEMTGYAQRLRL